MGRTLGQDRGRVTSATSVLNSGAVIGGMLASKLADRSGPQRIVATTFVLAAIPLALMTFA
ncbi:hypothetical protein [Kocuria indica]|uniref:hypothetical protein n=1 Tax=Kocuria TaxID=57493 RepID=UPI001642AB76|nr:hypothetical protein [Kocuria indica]